MITSEQIQELFHYRDNNLWWKERPKFASSIDLSKPAGSIHSLGYRSITTNGKAYKAHRLIYKMFNPDWDIDDTSHANQIDHRDTNQLNNGIVNLRKATNSQNQYNRGIYKTNTSGSKGVYWNKQAKKWRAQIAKDNKKMYLGSFDNQEDAAAAYRKAANELYGEFANHAR